MGHPHPARPSGARIHGERAPAGRARPAGSEGDARPAARTLRNQALVDDTGQAVLDRIAGYADTWRLLLEYDEDRMAAPPGTGLSSGVLDHDRAIAAIAEFRRDLMARKQASSLFGSPRGDALAAILETWRGYKLHIDTADCGVPLSAILTSASVHDSQAAIPLATMTAGRVVNLYDLMDAAYDAREIHEVSKRLGHIPVIDTNPRRDKALKQARNREARAQRAAGYPDARTVRYRIRTVVERTNARLKDEFGAGHARVRGPTGPARTPIRGSPAI